MVLECCVDYYSGLLSLTSNASWTPMQDYLHLWKLQAMQQEQAGMMLRPGISVSGVCRAVSISRRLRLRCSVPLMCIISCAMMVAMRISAPASASSMCLPDRQS